MIFGTILWLLSACGHHARIMLPLGVVIALLMPSNGAFFKPATPFILAILVGCALVRLDIGAALKAALRPQRLFRNAFIAIAGKPALARWVKIAIIAKDLVATGSETAARIPLSPRLIRFFSVAKTRMGNSL